MTNEEKKEFYTCNIQDFMKRFKAQDYSDPNEALRDAMNYIARYNLDPKSTKCDINELLFLSRNEILKLLARKEINDKENGINTSSDKNSNLMVKSFIANPVKATSYYLNKKQDTFDKLRKSSKDSLYITLIRQNAAYWASRLGKPQYSKEYRKFVDKRSKAIDLVATLEAQMPYTYDPIGSFFKKNKPTFFENLISSSSKEYKAFVKVFNNHYRNPNSPLYGDDAYVKNYALAYLHHKFPKLKDNELPTLEQLDTLSTRGKARSLFCLNLVNSVNEKEAILEKMDEVNEEINNSIDEYSWDKNQEKSQLEEQLELEDKNDIIPVDDDISKNENIIDDNEENLDQEINVLELNNEKDIFKD